MADQEIRTGLTASFAQRRLSRRDFVRRAGALGLSSSAVAAFLAACGASPTATSAPAAATATKPAASTAPSTASGGASAAPATATRAATAASGGGAGAVVNPTVLPPATGKKGGEIIIGTLGEANNINPFLYNESEGTWRARMLFGQMVKLRPDTFVAVPGLAKAWKVEGNTFTFTLQDKAKFSDGSDLTADDVAFTMKGILAKATASPNRTRLASIQGAKEFYDGTAQDVAGIKVVDPKTIVITLATPDASFLTNM